VPMHVQCICVWLLGLDGTTINQLLFVTDVYCELVLVFFKIRYSSVFRAK